MMKIDEKVQKGVLRRKTGGNFEPIVLVPLAECGGLSSANKVVQR